MGARRIAAGAAATVVAGLSMAVLRGGSAGAADTVDEIHYSYGDAPTSVVLDWRGEETTVAYGPTSAYGFVAVAAPPAVAPVDSPGPFREVVLSGLAPDTDYHYRIGAGADHVLHTVALGSFRWVDVGDTASALCKPWEAQVHALIERLGPWFVTHGGDISEANVCGTAAVHAYYRDQQVWSTAAAFQPVWGNHDYAQPAPGAPPGTPRDSLANYKGRSALTHARPVSLDTPARTTPPGCPGVGGVNGCRGEDWGWFRAGGVLFISYPEPWTGALADWRPEADALLAQAQADPTVDFVVTYGHRPAYSSQTANGWDAGVRAALDALARRYSPRTDNPAGKYVLNLAHHVHALEVFAPIDGLTHVTNATGGQGTSSLPVPAPGSVLRFSHPGVLAGDYAAAAHRLTLRWVCGPALGTKDTCGYGDTVWSTAFTAGVPGPVPPGPVPPGPSPSATPPGPSPPGPSPSPSPPSPSPPGPSPTSPSPPRPTPSGSATTPPPAGPVQWVRNPGVETDLTGWTGRYGASSAVTVARVTTAAHSGRASIRVAAGPGAANLTSGFNDRPRWVTRTSGGTAYTASAWLRPGLTGQSLALRLREWSGTGALLTDRTSTLRAAATGWQRVSVQLTAARSGGSMSLAVYARDLDSGEWFLADDLSLTSN
ncbi:fibronectin type III domain-containing protein [Krasilnikovia sp. M28-CT-15]|uniref:fibronectin type III domain-containing protein n=1 Tax=Krasilnikovia sp. M28-CT-15 TaxID=3373540 RepID=UPI003877858E